VGKALDMALTGLMPLLESAGAAQAGSAQRETVLAILNGVMGDHLVASGNPLAISMTLRHQGQALRWDVEPRPAHLAGAAPKALLMIHGLCMNDLQWHTEKDGKVVDHGETISAALGYTPIHVRYNTGLHTSQNGHQLAAELEQMVHHWPVPLDEITVLVHSMGGLLVGRFVAEGLAPAPAAWYRPVDALVMSSPALDAGMNAFQKFLVSVLPKIAPDLRVGNGVKPQFVSHDPAVVAAYKADPLVHDRISARLARFIAEAGPQTLALASQWKVPTLLMYAGDDRLLNADGSRNFAKLAPKDVVSTQCFDSLYHEIFNELDAKPVFAALKQWLDKRF